MLPLILPESVNNAQERFSYKRETRSSEKPQHGGTNPCTLTKLHRRGNLGGGVWSSCNRVKGRSHTVEKRIRMHPQTSCNQPAIAQTHHTSSTATNSTPYTCPIMTSALDLWSPPGAQQSRGIRRVTDSMLISSRMWVPDY